MSSNTITEIDTVTVLVKVTVTETNIVTVPTQDYECRISDLEIYTQTFRLYDIKTVKVTHMESNILTHIKTQIAKQV